MIAYLARPERSGMMRVAADLGLLHRQARPARRGKLPFPRAGFCSQSIGLCQADHGDIICCETKCSVRKERR